MSSSFRPQAMLPSPEECKIKVPISESQRRYVASARAAIMDCLGKRDPRMLIVCGPCSIADIPSAVEYAERLKALQPEVDDVFLLVMRTYFQKPRTTIGWKGLVYDPFLDGTFRVADGLRLARELLKTLAEAGVPTACEAVDPLVHEYFEDLVSWTAIGARTSESQVHREYASGLSCPVGFKNGIGGNLEPAIYGVIAARHPQRFLAITGDGSFALRETGGNAATHVILRGGHRPNYDSVSVNQCAQLLETNGISEGIIIDCSHGNSGKDASRQPLVFRDCMSQVVNGNSPIRGLMLESNLLWGSQQFPVDSSQFTPGLSLTDACICWDTTAGLIREGAERLRNRERSQTWVLPRADTACSSPP